MPPRHLLAALSHFPWQSTVATLRERFREDRLGVTASSLTFTTTMALVPFFTVALAVFTAFPIFAKLQGTLQAWLVQSLIPDAIARQVLGYLTQFAGKASQLGAFGLAALIVTALALVLTIDHTLNSIWRVKRSRPLAQRVLIYWAAMTLGPLLLGASLSITSYAISSSRGLVSAVPGAIQLLLGVIEFFLLAAGMAALYRYVPNAPVRRSHAWAGGLFAAAGLEVARRVLAWYIGKVPTYSVVYGAFATVPILLVWIYVAWLVVLLGAVLAAYLPSLLARKRRRTGPGWQFQVALEVLAELHRARAVPRRGLSAPQLQELLELEVVQLEPVLEALVALDWIGRLNEIDAEAETRYLLLADPRSTRVEPLAREFLLPRSAITEPVWKTQLSSVWLLEVIEPQPAAALPVERAAALTRV